ncbi:hypothetical protein NHQ30_008763 [Ciborinia camelliae]|nr:hypothetical protein NHQ30_008763 [Ciborinia camelliae]
MRMHSLRPYTSNAEFNTHCAALSYLTARVSNKDEASARASIYIALPYSALQSFVELPRCGSVFKILGLGRGKFGNSFEFFQNA